MAGGLNSQVNNTPMMKQYLSIKNQHKDSILFFRLGDFYEMFMDDAIEASKILEIALTTRHKASDNPVPLCGIPYHSADTYIAKLLKAGKRIAICEQVEDPKKAKGIVKREVTRIITPGLNLDEKLLQADKNNYLLSYHPSNTGTAICFIDISSEEFQYSFINNTHSPLDILESLEPKEIIVPHSLVSKSISNTLRNTLKNTFFTFIEDGDDFLDVLNGPLVQEKIVHDQTDNREAIIKSIQTVLRYLKKTHSYTPKLLHSLKFYEIDLFMGLDIRTRKNLELIDSHNQEDTSLYKCLDYTKTPMAKRKLKQWILNPLVQKNLIEKRLNAVEFLVNERFFREDLQDILASLYDLNRLVGKVTQNSLNPKDLLALKNSLNACESLVTIEKPENSTQLLEINFATIKDALASCKDLLNLLENAVSENPPYSIKDGGAIKAGYNEDLDKLRSIRFNTKEVIASIENRERENTKINNLKIKHNKVFGYFIEVSSSKLNLVPDNYIRKQTIANGERYITEELKELETKVITAQEKIEALEQELFDNLRKQVLEKSIQILAIGDSAASLDVLCSLATAAQTNNYIKPELCNNNMFDIKAGRHPVVEKLCPGQFVPNDTFMDANEQNQIILTGPNMAGKSTIMRQVALIALMAQMGSFVPAEAAKIGLVDKLFTRIGASDNLAGGDSTFMVEMKETAYILSNASKSSLILLDELGRGTSTFDGVSLAWAIAEYIHKNIKARTLFATHYHELTNLSKKYKSIKNFHVAVKQKGEEIFFLHKMLEGGVNRSYGIHVAKLAKLPENVLGSAYKKLEDLETAQAQGGQLSLFSNTEIKNEDKDTFMNEIIEELKLFDTSNTTPVEALVFLDKIKNKLKQENNI